MGYRPGGGKESDTTEQLGTPNPIPAQFCYRLHKGIALLFFSVIRRNFVGSLATVSFKSLQGEIRERVDLGKKNKHLS